MAAGDCLAGGVEFSWESEIRRGVEGATELLSSPACKVAKSGVRPDIKLRLGADKLCSTAPPLRCTVAALMKAKVIVMPKQSILDPQGVAVRDAVQHQGLDGVKGVRVGKLIELEIDGALDEGRLHEVCLDLLSNPVIEDYEVVVEA
jgi:phosphoribosylformylglycinamidine synthase PurS subunit